MSEWLGRTLPISPRLCLVRDKSQVHNISKELSVIMTGLTTTARTILTYCKSAKPPEMKEWVNYMIKTASYESMLIRRNDENK